MRYVPGVVFLASVGTAQTRLTAFTLTEISQRFDAAGKLISESRLLIAKDGNGSIVAVDLDAGSDAVRQIIDAKNQRIVLINPRSRSATISSPYSRPASVSVPSCESRFGSIVGATVSVDRSTGDVAGVPVDRIVVTRPHLVLDALVAPGLGCEMLKSVTSRDGQISESRIAKDVRVGAPDPALFQIPANYRVERSGFR